MNAAPIITAPAPELAQLPPHTPAWKRQRSVLLRNLEPRTWVCECGQVNTQDLDECFICAWPKGQ